MKFTELHLAEDILSAVAKVGFVEPSPIQELTIPLALEGKDVIIIDDMISSGESMIDVATELKRRKANRIFVAATFGLFTNGMEKFDEAHEKGLIDKVLTTNLVYQPEEVLKRDYYINVDMSKYVALLIDTLNHDQSISDLLNPTERIQAVLKKYGQI